MAERVAGRSWQALELTKLALRQHRPATTAFDIAAQAVLFESEDKRAADDRVPGRPGEASPRPGSRAASRRSVEKPGAARPGCVADPVPPFRVRQLTIEDGLDLAGWSRPGAWHIEDALEAPEPDEGYWAVVDTRRRLLGFCCVGAAARVPGRHRDDYVLDVAIGIRPQLAGRGWSGELGRAAVAICRVGGAGPPAADHRRRNGTRSAGTPHSRPGSPGSRTPGLEPPAIRDLRADTMIRPIAAAPQGVNT